MQIEWKKRTAKLTSNIMNPFSISVLMIVLLSFTSTSGASDAFKWLFISIALSILPVFTIIVYLVHNHRLENIFIRSRKQRNSIYLLASACTLIGCIALYFLGAPRVLVASFLTALSAIVIFMCINLWWKISIHTAFATASVTVLIILYGSPGVAAATLLLPIGWSRIELEYHSPAQVVAGALVAALIVAVVFHLFGLLWPPL